MPEKEFNQQTDFLIEKIKERPINKTRLVRRTLITAAMAVIFGLVAGVTFLLLQPVITKFLYPEEPQPQVFFPEEVNEMSPEDMLADNLPQEKDEVYEFVQPNYGELLLDRNHYKQLYGAMADYVQDLKHSMVIVTGVRSNVDWLQNVQEKQYQTTGAIIAGNAKEYFILTEYSPIEEAQKFSITPCYNSRFSAVAELKAFDNITNLAVLSVKLEGLPAELLSDDGLQVASLGSSNLRNLEGVPVVAIGTPMGALGSVGYGMITATSDQFSTVDSNYKLLQTDIIGSQVAGGVLFNLDREIVGIITTNGNTYDMKNQISAFGITDLKSRMEKMSNEMEIAYIGVIGGNVTPAAHEEQGVPYGAYVQKVAADSPAMEVGIQQGDIITMIDGRYIASYSEYTNVLMQLEAGSEISLTLSRQVQNEFKEMTIDITLGAVK